MSFYGCAFENLCRGKLKVPVAFAGTLPSKGKPMTCMETDWVSQFICSGFAFKD
jgi:hypothetical protein